MMVGEAVAFIAKPTARVGTRCLPLRTPVPRPFPHG